MRIRIKSYEGIGQFDRRITDVTMHVQFYHQGRISANGGTHSCKEIALRIFSTINYHRTMEG